MKRRLGWWLGLLGLVLAGRASVAVAQTTPAPRVVSPTGPYHTITAALAEAQPGEVIEVRGGVYPALVVDKPVTLQGVGWPVLDGGGQDTVVRLAAPGIVLRGFEVRGSGNEPDRDHSGIIVTAPRVVVEGNRLREVLFGVYVSQADDVVVRGNDITSKSGNTEARRGDGIRLWYSARTLVEANHLHEARDLVAWYSKTLIFRGNTLANGRYAVHLMYCDDALVADNRLLNNSVGMYVMYSTNVRLVGNELRGQRGPSGYALGFKDAENVEVRDNLIVDNRAGMYLDGTPFSPQGWARFTGNVIAFNDLGVILLPSAKRNVFTDNTFWENVEQVALQGGGQRAVDNEWRGNYWSDYAGYDADGDGVGDVPYRAERFFEGLTDREPLLRSLLYSPAAQALEFAGAALPVFKPQPKLEDAAPRMAPAPLPARAANTAGAAGWLTLLPLGVGVLCALLGGLMPVKPSAAAAPLAPAPPAGAPTLEARAVTKRYGAVLALDQVTFAAQPGEALALWGANGAGKTTLIKALLGLITVEGQITLQGFEVRRQGKQARRQLGYVPQDMAFHDMSVQATLDFYAALKGGEAARRAPALLETLGLRAHAHKPVPALSGGLRQRLALAVALLADPPVLLLDEPTANLDAQAQREYLALLYQLCRESGKTLLFASHRLEEVELLAHRVLYLEHGRLVDVLTPAELLTRLMPDIKLTLWMPEAERPAALARFTGAGFQAHLNGHGTVVVQVRADRKLELLHLMRELPVADFEMARGQAA